MPLLNYTTTIDVHKTLGEIQKILVQHGARRLMYEYSDEGRIEALCFTVITPDCERGIKLPANISAIFEVIQRDPKVPKALKIYEQAERVAWRIIKDWVEAQMAILDTQMVEFEEIFLPYMLNNKGQTFFQAYQQKQLNSGGD